MGRECGTKNYRPALHRLNEALTAMRPKSSEEKKQELERARGIGYKRLRRPLEEIVEEQKQRKREREQEG